MSAPEIPNLLSMRGAGRGGRGGRGGREGRGGRGGPHGPSSVHLTPAQLADLKDRLIQATDTDASVSRLSAVKTGYLEDPYAKEFALGETPRRFPIINRGTYVRTSALDHLITTFLTTNAHVTKQIISLGAGTDTRFWRLRDAGLLDRTLYHEIDFPTISTQKLAIIRSSSRLSPQDHSFGVLHGEQEGEDPAVHRWGFFRNSEHTEGYLFHPIDLRREGWIINNLLPDAPTLLISECCLCYMTPQEASKVVQEFGRLLPTLGILFYEPTKPEDDFGKVMFQNLASRGLRMPTVGEYPTVESQMQRLNELGFTGGSDAADVAWLWKNWVDGQERARVDRLEGLDEVEEWELLAGHYLITWGWRVAPFGNDVWRGWNERCVGMLGEAVGGDNDDRDHHDNDEEASDEESEDDSPPTPRG